MNPCIYKPKEDVAYAGCSKDEPAFTIEVGIGNSQAIATIDSGCTGMLASRALVDRLGLPTYRGIKRRLEFAQGSSAITDTYVTIPTRIGTKTRPLEFLVASITAELLLGLRWLRQANPAIDWTYGHLKIDGEAIDATPHRED